MQGSGGFPIPALCCICKVRKYTDSSKGVKLGEGRNKAAPTLHTDIFSIIKIPKTYFTLLISGFLETCCDYITSIVLTGVETEKALNEESVLPIPFVIPNTDIIPFILNFPSSFTNTSTIYKSSKQEDQVSSTQTQPPETKQ